LTRPSLLDDFGDLAGHALDALVFMAAGDNLAIAIGVRKIFFPVIAHYWTAPSASPSARDLPSGEYARLAGPFPDIRQCDLLAIDRRAVERYRDEWD
jgi:hypothetical protein